MTSLSDSYILWVVGHLLLCFINISPLRKFIIIASLATLFSLYCIKDDTFDKVTYIGYFNDPSMYGDFTFEPLFRLVYESLHAQLGSQGQLIYDSSVIFFGMILLYGIRKLSKSIWSVDALLISVIFLLSSQYFLSASQIFFRQYIALSLAPLFFYLFEKNKYKSIALALIGMGFHSSFLFVVIIATLLSKPKKINPILLTGIGSVIGFAIFYTYSMIGLNDVLTDGSEGGFLNGYMKALIVLLYLLLTNPPKSIININMRSKPFIYGRYLLIGLILSSTVMNYFGMAARMTLMFMFFDVCMFVSCMKYFLNNYRIYIFIALSAFSTSAYQILSNVSTV